MTQIDFYTNVTDKLVTACRIAAKAYGLEHRVMIFCADAERAQHIDRLLWSTPPDILGAPGSSGVTGSRNSGLGLRTLESVMRPFKRSDSPKSQS